MPHSPRWHDGRLWLLNSGTGEFGFVDLDGGRSSRSPSAPATRAASPSSATSRWSACRGDRADRTFDGLPLELNLARRLVHPRCGLHVIDLKPRARRSSGSISTAVIDELYDLVCLPGVVRPKAVGFDPKEIEGVINIGHRATF